MDEITKIKQLLAEGIVMSSNVDNPTLSEHRTLEYCELAQKKLKEAGTIVHQLTPDLNDMIQFAIEYVPEQHRNKINHAWSGIGEWRA
jgi:hypothetical protein